MNTSWKLKRELKRLRNQVLQFHWFIFGSLRRRSYDRKRSSLVKIHDGAQPAREKIAITLCFQPNGILPTFLAELDHFVASGFSPVVVSNLPLSAQDRSALMERSLLVIERPNYGYDFGGYREGILCLFERGIKPGHLVLKNDSVWFPLWPDSDLLNRAVADDHDIFGVFLNSHGRKRRQTHLQSYFYSFNEKIVSSLEFRHYWQNLFMTNNKHAVVRQCEVKLTDWFRSKGFTIGQLFDAEAMRTAIKSLTDSELLDYISYQVKLETRLEKTLRPLIDNPQRDNWRQNIERLIEEGRFRNYHLAARPYILFGALKSSLLKKDRQLIYQIQRREIVEKGYTDMMLYVFSNEISNWD